MQSIFLKQINNATFANIKFLLSVFENKEKMVLVMEIAAGGELYDYLSERRSLEELEARRIFRQIATAVFYCHKVCKLFLHV